MNRGWERRGGLVWPMVLILGGIMLLLNNLGRFEWSLWDLVFRLWPAILLAAGVDLLIPRRSAWGSLLAAVLILGVFLGSFWLLTVAEAQPQGGTAVREELEGSQSAELKLSPAVGLLSLRAGAPEGALIAGTTQADIGEVVKQVSRAAGRTTLSLQTDTNPGPIFFFPSAQAAWNLRVTEAVPLTLKAEIGAGEVDLDLRGLIVPFASVAFGVGRAEVRLPTAGDLEGSIEGGVGEILVLIPRGAAVQLRISKGLVALSLPASYVRSGEVATSPTANQGQITMHLSIDLGVGAITVGEVGN